MQNNLAIGRITKDIELKYTSNNKAVAEISIAINNNKDDTTFLNVTCFEKNAENVSKYCNKGDMIAVAFIIKNYKYTDKDGNNRNGFNFVANKVNFLSTSNKNHTNDIQTNKQANDPYEDFGTEITEEDMPF